MDLLKRHVFLALAFMFAAFSSFGVYRFLQHRESVSTASVTVNVPVVVAGQELQVGHQLREGDLILQQWPTASGSKDYFQDKKVLIGKTLRSRLVPLEPVTVSKLLGDDQPNRLAIPPHMRGIAVSVRRSETLSKVLQVGSALDVLAIPDTTENGARSRVIAQSVRVLAIDANTLALGSEKAPSRMEIILLVNPREAMNIAQAVNYGTIELVVTGTERTGIEI